MRVRRWCAAWCCVAVLPVLVTGCAATMGSAPVRDARPALYGAWELVGPDLAPGTREVKLITPHRFSWTTWDVATHEVLAAGGGTSVVHGRAYVETLEYSKGGTEGLVGQTLRFEVAINGDTMLQRGVEGGALPELREVWRRVQ